MSKVFVTWIIFIEISPDQTPRWFWFDAKNIPVTFDQLNGSTGFRKTYPNLLTEVPSKNVNHWQKFMMMEGIHFLAAIGYP
jgi:hypothetical protein